MNSKALIGILAAMALAVAATAAPAFAQEGSDPLAPTPPSSAAKPDVQTPNTAPAQAAPSLPPKAVPSPAPQATAPATQHTASIPARAAAPVRRAAARFALAVSNVNLRSAPGTNAEIVTTIPGGSTVRITGCTGDWCAVSWQGRSGFAVARAFDSGGSRQARSYRAPPAYDDEDVVEAGPPVYYEPPPRVVYGPGYYYRPRYYYGPRWRYAW